MLDRGRAEVFANPVQNVRSRVAVIAEDAYLDQFVGGQGTVDFAGYGRCQAAVADQYSGFEGMGAGFEGPALGGRELQRHVNLLQTGILG
jgi:hypothetical protein